MGAHFDLVTSSLQLREVVREARGTGRVALDTESASFHRYLDRVYLIQLATAEAVWVVDPLPIDDLDAIGELLADPEVELVLHDADFDLRTLHRDYGFTARNVFDTRIAAAFAGEESVGLAPLLEKHFDVRLDKRFQRADWSARPLTNDMLDYAADDTRHLIPLRHLLYDLLDRAGRWSWAFEEFAALEDVRWEAPDGSEAYLRLKGSKGLRPRQRAVLRELYLWRDDTARSLDRAPFRVSSNDVLLAVARAHPRSRSQLRETRGVPESVARRYGAQMVAAVERALAIPDADLPQTPKRNRTRPDTAEEARFERLKQLRNVCATKHQLAPGLVCPNHTLLRIARAASSDEHAALHNVGLKNWQLNVIGEASLRQAIAGGAAG